MQIDDFFSRLSEKGIISQGDTGSALQSTQGLLEGADKLWAEALKGSLLGKVEQDSLGEWVIKPEYVSAIRMEENLDGAKVMRPVADLVQQGGGMFGIALVGYTYIMEKAGIRFYSLGGTSAGAINTMLLGVLPNDIYAQPSAAKEGKRATKSEVLAHIIANTDFSRFMDRRGIAGWLQTRLFRKRHPMTLLRLFVVPGILFAIGLYTMFSFLLNEKNQMTTALTRFYDYIIGTLAIIAPLLLAYLLLVRMLGNDFGINTGEAFYKWLRAILNDPYVDVPTQKRLEERLQLNRFVGQEPNEKPRMVLITSNLTYNRIVKFPESAPLYWQPADNVSPAAYVRASMSIPFVFEAFIPSLQHVEHQDQPTVHPARFVDGGMLSNFPIREFHSRQQPRFPTFGVLLSESRVDLSPKKKQPQQIQPLPKIKLLGFIISFLSTFRNFYDNDFLASSEEIKMRVVTVNTSGFNWLDFWMGDSAKKDLFNRGAQAAIEQLRKFEWEDYLEERHKINL